MLNLIYLLIIGSFLLLMLGIKPYQRPQRLIERISPEAKTLKSTWRKWLKPLISLSQVIASGLKLEEGLRKRLASAKVRLAPSEYFAIKIGIIIAGLVITYFTFAKLDFLKVGIAILLGYSISDIWLMRRIRLRKRAIARILPETVDLLGLCIEAGLNFTTAMHWVIEKTRLNPLLEELSFVLEEIRWGKSRTQALKDMSKRLNIPEVSSFVQVLVQAERMGTPVSETFMIISEDTRLRRFHQGERIAMQAPIKILMPLIFCILPVIGIIIGGPILLQFMRGGMFKF